MGKENFAKKERRMELDRSLWDNYNISIAMRFRESKTVFEGKSTLALSPRERRRRTNADNIIPLAMEVFEMLDEYDFSGARKNPYAKKLKKQITINLDADTIDDFKAQSDQSGIPYQTLINLYLADCAAKKKQLSINWN